MIDFDAEILDLAGKPLKIEPGKDAVVTLELVATSALTAQLQDENPSGKEKFDRFMLATKCKGQATLKAEEIALLKERIGKVGMPLVVGRAWQLLDAAET